MKFRNVNQVASWRLCVACGACASICPEKKIELFDIADDGIRPFLNSEDCGDCRECITVCPGIETVHNHVISESGLIAGLKEEFGPVLEIWEGYATDRDIRYHGSSGGLATALALYCVEKEGMYGVLHTCASSQHPWKNDSLLSRNREHLLSRTGSRYSPASPCDGLGHMESAPSPCVFIGKPCDIAGLRKAQQLREKLDSNVGIAIGIFCAGTPSTQGTLDLFKRLKLASQEVEAIRYRGTGWPGMTTIRLKGNEPSFHEISYKESWGFLNNYRPFRCYLCPDGTSEFADISCGDPWYREPKEDDMGYSLLLVRTERGQRIVHGAMEAGYVALEQADPKVLRDSQENLLLKRRAVWGRLFTMKLLHVPAPRYKGFSLFKSWLNLPISEKLRSILGTARRIVQRKYYRPASYQ